MTKKLSRALNCLQLDILHTYVEYGGRRRWPPQRLDLCQPFQVHESFDHAFAIDQRVQQNRQEGRAGGPAHPSEQQTENENLTDRVLVISPLHGVATS